MRSQRSTLTVVTPESHLSVVPTRGDVIPFAMPEEAWTLEFPLQLSTKQPMVPFLQAHGFVNVHETTDGRVEATTTRSITFDVDERRGVTYYYKDWVLIFTYHWLCTYLPRKEVRPA